VQEAYRRSTSIPPFPQGETAPLAIDEEQWSGRQDIVTMARRCGLSLYYSPSMRNGAAEFDGEREDKGNAILSSLPLHDFLAIELPFETQRRIVVGATVRHPAGDSLRVLSLHLDVSPGLWRVLKTGNSSRLRQAMGIVDALDDTERSRSGRPFVATDVCEHTCEDSARSHAISTLLAGDFNTWTDGQTVIRHMFVYFPDSPPTDGLPTRGEFPADHMFFRQRSSWDGDEPQLVPDSYRRLDQQYGSDHKARVLELRW
jgi:endonuclease/exonuclease/phosphatase family metal-dependent hydrolase